MSSFGATPYKPATIRTALLDLDALLKSVDPSVVEQLANSEVYRNASGRLKSHFLSYLLLTDVGRGFLDQDVEARNIAEQLFEYAKEFIQQAAQQQRTVVESLQQQVAELKQQLEGKKHASKSS
jgi:hypothetical protein